MTETATETPSAPELRSLQRVQSIPLVNDTLSSIHTILVQNALTAWPYARAQSISTSAYSIAAPRLQSIDGLANRGLDYVEEKYPYPFTTPTKDMYDDIQKTASSAYDARVRASVAGLAQGADKTITPFVNVLQTAYDRLNSLNGAQPAEQDEQQPADGGETQVHRALRLATGVKDQVVVLSAEQLRQMQQQSAILQRLTNDLYNLNALATSSVTALKNTAKNTAGEGYARAGALADSTRAELERLSSTLRAMPASLQQSLAPTLEQLQTRLADVQGNIAAVYHEEGVSSGDKAIKALGVVREQVQPLAEQAYRLALDSVHGVASYLRHTVEQAPPAQNGHAPDSNGDSTH